jgi:hypothetical protein
METGPQSFLESAWKSAASTAQSTSAVTARSFLPDVELIEAAAVPQSRESVRHAVRPCRVGTREQGIRQHDHSRGPTAALMSHWKTLIAEGRDRPAALRHR